MTGSTTPETAMVAQVAEAGTGSGSATAPADAEPTTALSEVVVSTRNRVEKAQDVPVPVAVISGQTLDRKDQVSFKDITRDAPNIFINEQNPRQSSITIRGLGKQGATDAMEASVGVIVDDVFLDYGAYTWQDFTDLDSVEIARGPQGTLEGKNTTLGVVKINTRKPSFTPGYDLEVDRGTLDYFDAKGAATGPLIDGVLAYRVSFYVDRRDGWVSNLYPDDASFNNRNRLGGRLQLLAHLADNLTARFIFTHASSTEYSNGATVLSGDPATYSDGTSRTANGGQTFSSRLARSYFNGYTPDFALGNAVDVNDQQPLKLGINMASAEINWALGGYLLTSITSWNQLSFIARNDIDLTPFTIGYNWNTNAFNHQLSQEFRLLSPRGGPIDYQIGVYGLREVTTTGLKNEFGPDAGAFFASNTQYTHLGGAGNEAGQRLLQDSLNGVYTVVGQHPTIDSVAPYGQFNWHFSPRGTLTVGARLTHENRDNQTGKTLLDPGVALGADDATAERYFSTSYASLSAAQQQQITDALAIRNGKNGIGTLYQVKGIPIDDTSYAALFNPSYKLTPDVLLYASLAYGEKSGVVQFSSSTGAPQNADPEKALDYELGVKSEWLGHRLRVNLNLYRTQVRGYQTQLSVVDPNASTGFTSILGNASRVTLQGLEYDASYRWTRDLSFWLAGSYGSSIFSSFHDAPCPSEQANASPQCDLTGRQLPGASRLNNKVGVDYHLLVFGRYALRADLSDTFYSRTNLSTSLSSYGEQDAYHLVDLGAGFGRADGTYELSLQVKNLFDAHYLTSVTNFSSTVPNSYNPGMPRWVYVAFKARL